jgi:hypothetical protein
MPLEKCQSDPRFRSTAESCHNSEFRVPGHCYFGVPTKPSVFPVRVDVESDNLAKIIKPVDRGRAEERHFPVLAFWTNPCIVVPMSSTLIT